jgi:hypothetical protein
MRSGSLLATIATIATIAALAAASAGAQVGSGVTEMSPANGTALPDPQGANLDSVLRSNAAEQPSAARLAYLENLRVRREQAEQYAAAAHNGVALPSDAAAALRDELAADIEQWRVEFGVRRKDARAMRDEWLVAPDSLTAIEWADRRVAWWTARDAWVAGHHR